MSDFTLAVDAEGVATITWDCPGRPINVLTLEAARTLETLVTEAQDDPAVKGIVLTSGKKDFAAGMDLSVLAKVREEGGDDPAAAIFGLEMSVHHLLRRIELGRGSEEATPKPTAVAIPGTALGFGLELSLACHRRFAAANLRAKIGLPEIKVGLFPGGCTTRLSRMLGLMGAAPFLLQGRLVDPEGARTAGLIDEVVPPEELMARARAWVLAATPDELVKPWDRKGWKFPGGAPYTPAGYQTFVGAAAMVAAETQNRYPAAQSALSAIYEGAQLPFDAALRVEARWFTHVLLDPTASAMIRTLFLGKRALEKGAARSAQAPAERVARLGVIGAGMMGAAIAHVAARAGIEVVLLDRDQAAAEKGKAHAQTALEKDRARGRLNAGQAEAILSRITPGTGFEALASCDLVIEAVYEDPQVKAEALSRAAAVLGAQAVLASNTSTLPISGLSQSVARPQDFLGLHFFSPVERMSLVEVIRGRATGARALAVALGLVAQLKKTPIVVGDGRFFYANRCIIPYLNEGMRMLAEGVAPALIENAARQFGLPLGPLQLVDETSIELGARIARASAATPETATPGSAEAVLFWMEAEGRLGRRARAGFYDYDADGHRLGLSPAVQARFAPLPADRQPAAEEVQMRLALVQAFEAVQALEEEVLPDPLSGDVGAVLGWGFAPWSGGPFAWLDRLGADRAIALAEPLAARLGPRFEAPRLLRDMARDGSRFHPATGAA